MNLIERIMPFERLDVHTDVVSTIVKEASCQIPVSRLTSTGTMSRCLLKHMPSASSSRYKKSLILCTIATSLFVKSDVCFAGYMAKQTV